MPGSPGRDEAEGCWVSGVRGSHVPTAPRNEYKSTVGAGVRLSSHSGEGSGFLIAKIAT